MQSVLTEYHNQALQSVLTEYHNQALQSVLTEYHNQAITQLLSSIDMQTIPSLISRSIFCKLSPPTAMCVTVVMWQSLYSILLCLEMKPTSKNKTLVVVKGSMLIQVD